MDRSVSRGTQNLPAGGDRKDGTAQALEPVALIAAPPAKPELPEPKPQPPEPKPDQGTKPSRARWLWLLILAALAAGTWYFWPYLKSKAGSPGAPTSGARGKKGGPAVVPVVAAKARKGNIGVYFNGLGSVTPIYTVTVKSRVDGQLMKVSLPRRRPGARGRPADGDRPAALPGPTRHRPKASWRATRPRSITRASI